MRILNSRRSFVWKLGPVRLPCWRQWRVRPALATPKADSSARTGNTAPLRVALLEEEKVLRKLHQAFEQAMDKGLHEEVIGMFADDAEVVFNGGVFSQRSNGVSRLYRERFPSGKTGGRMEPAPGFELAADQQTRQRGRVSGSSCLQRRYSPIRSRWACRSRPRHRSPPWPVFTEKACAHGGKVASTGSPIGRTLRAAGRSAGSNTTRCPVPTGGSGRSYAQPISVARFSTRFPADQQGPDDLM